MSESVNRSSKEPRISGVWKSSHEVVICEQPDNRLPVPVKLNPLGFPKAPVELQRLPRSSGNRNVSLFVARRKHELNPDVDIMHDSQSTLMADGNTGENHQEADEIKTSASRDALNLFNNMDDEQRREYREMLLQTLPKELVDKWTQQSNSVEHPTDQYGEGTTQDQSHLKTEWMSPITPQDLIVDQDNPDLAIRFGFNGEIIASDIDISVLEGLHHHGREAGLAGYSIAELCLLLRSTIASQRVIALGVVVAILRRIYENSSFQTETTLANVMTPAMATSHAAQVTSLESLQTVPTLPSDCDGFHGASPSSNGVSLSNVIWNELVQRQKVYLLLRTTLDANNAHQICLSLEALFFLVAPPDLIQHLDEFDYEGGHFLNPVVSNTNVLQKLTKFLLIQRLRYLIEVSGSYHVGIRHAALDLLIAIAAYSSEIAMSIAECPRMLTVLYGFVRNPSEIDYITLLSSLRLLRLLAQSDRDIASAISSPLIRSYLSAILLNPPQISHALECIRIWTVFRLYDPESGFFDFPCAVLNDLTSFGSKMQRSLVKFIAQNPGDFIFDVQNFMKSDCLPAILGLIPSTMPCSEPDQNDFALQLAKLWKSYWESCLTSFFQTKQICDSVRNADCHLFVLRGLPSDSVTDDMCLLVKSFLTLRCGALADALREEGYIDDFRRICKTYRTRPAAINVIDGHLYANLILILQWIGDDVMEDALMLPTLSFPGSEPILYQIITSGACTFNSIYFRDLLRVVWLGSLCTDWTPSSLYAGSNFQLPLSSDWILVSTLEALQHSGDDFSSVSVPRLQSLLATWQRLSIRKNALFQALLRVFSLGCEVFLSSAIEPLLRALLQSCFKDEMFSISLDSSLVSHVASVFAEESFGSGIFASCLMAIVARGKTELKLALCGALGTSALSRLRCDPEPIPFPACNYLYPSETDADQLLFYRQVLIDVSVSNDSWLYIVAIHHIYCSFFDHENCHDAPILEIRSFLHEAPKEVVSELLQYKKFPAEIRSFSALAHQQIPAHVGAVLKLVAENDLVVQRVLSELPFYPSYD